MNVLILAIILFALCSVSLLIYQGIWGPFFQALQELPSQLAQGWQEAKAEVEQEEASSIKAQQHKRPLYLRAALPVLYGLLFPLFYVVHAVWPQSPFVQKNPLVLFFLVFAALISLIFYVLQKDSKAARTKFWLCLPVSLIIEFTLAFTCTLLFSGYYFQSIGKLKHLGSAIFLLILFFSIAWQTQQHWLSWRCPTDAPHESEKSGELHG